MKKITLTLSLILIASSALAAPMRYIYEGPNFVEIVNDPLPDGAYTTDMSISGSFTVIEPLTSTELTDINDQVVSFSFSDGRREYTPEDSNFPFGPFRVAVDGNGQIVGWEIFIQVAPSVPLGLGDQFWQFSTQNTVPNFHDLAELRECLELENFFPFECSSRGMDQAGSEFEQMGSWTMEVVPIPAAAWLFGSALGLLGWMRRSRLNG